MITNLTLIGAILLLINLFSFVLVGIDKRKSIRGTGRIPEAWLFFIAVFFASAGVFFGMLIFRHKIRKAYFPIGIGFLLLEQSILILMMLSKIPPLN
jgi:uncharacterized membrane protein YsdA (DUF1294 family)